VGLIAPQGAKVSTAPQGRSALTEKTQLGKKPSTRRCDNPEVGGTRSCNAEACLVAWCATCAPVGDQ
jgi:hypothetical protein